MAEAISLFLSQVLDEWDLTNKLHVVVRDNGMNVVAAMTCGHFIGIPCLAHTLQLVIKDGLLHTCNVTNLATVCRRTGPLQAFLKSHKNIKGSTRDAECVKAQTQTISFDF